jgi:AraC-like DNA-binding protein
LGATLAWAWPSAAPSSTDRIDILVNNVGRTGVRTGGFLSVIDEQWQASIDLNRRSPPGDACGLGGELMAVLIDTRNVAVEDREESLHEAFAQAAVPRQIALSAEAVGSTRIDGWMFGSTKLFCPDSPGLEVIRTPPSGRLDPIIALCLQDRGTGRFRQEGQQWNLMPGEVIMAGPTSPNEFLITGATSAFEIPFDEIGLPFETVRKASGQLSASSLLPVVTDYLLSLRRDAEALSGSAGLDSVGAATTHLVRALIVSAAEDGRHLRSVLADALLPRIIAYVRQHLTDRSLTPASIARAHNISVRYLYKLCDDADVRLVEWIIEERLEGARRCLSAPDSASQPIALVAHRWGFKDPSHFSSRFRRAYGVSPRELQRHSRRHHQDQL